MALAEQRVAEAQAAAKVLGASLEFVELDGDAHLELRAAHAITLARRVREHKPDIVLAPTVVQNQHPDHWRLGTLFAMRCGWRATAASKSCARSRHIESNNCSITLSVPTPNHPMRCQSWSMSRERTSLQHGPPRCGPTPLRFKRATYVELQLSRARVSRAPSGREPRDPVIPERSNPLGFVGRSRARRSCLLIKQSQHR